MNKIVHFFCLWGLLFLCGCGETKLEVINKTVTVELMEECIVSISDIIDVSDLSQEKLEQIVMDVSEVNTSAIGIYPATIFWDKQQANFEVEVVDTTAPIVEITNDKIFCLQGDSIYLSELITNIRDNSSKLSIEVKDGEKVGNVSVENITFNDVKFSISEIGEYTREVVFKDESENETTCLINFTVVAPPVINACDGYIVINDEEALNQYIANISVSDDIDGYVTRGIEIDKDAIDISNLGKYFLNMVYENSKGFVAHKTVCISVINRPVINAEDKKIKLNDYKALEEYWNTISISDDIDGIVTEGILIDKDAVDCSTAGAYVVEIDYENSVGVIATKEVIITVYEEEESVDTVPILTYEEEVKQLQSKYVLNTIIESTTYSYNAGGEVPILVLYYWCSDITWGISGDTLSTADQDRMIKEYILAHPNCGVSLARYSISAGPIESLITDPRGAICQVIVRSQY